MDHELKQRLIGAIVVTALCAIFIPMLFDDPVDNSGQVVSELNIPAPTGSNTDTAAKLPGNAEQVLKATDPEPAAEPPAEVIENASAAEEMSEEPDKERSGESLYAESEGYNNADESVEEPMPKPRAKQALVEPATDAARKNLAAKAPIKEIVEDEATAREPAKAKKAVEPVKPAPVKEIASAAVAKEPARPTVVKKPEYEASVAADDVVKQVAPKPINSAKSLAAAVAEAKKPEAPKPQQKMLRWYIQLGSFSKKENAISLWDSLREQGLPASMDTVQTEHGVSYRLRVGPELDGKKAAAMKARLDRQNIKAILMSE